MPLYAQGFRVPGPSVRMAVLTGSVGRRLLLFGGGALLFLMIALALWFLLFYQDPYSRRLAEVRNNPLKIDEYRPGEIDLSPVEEMDLTLNGQPLFPGPHRVRYSQCLVQGTMSVHGLQDRNYPEYISKRHGDLVLALRPVDAPEREWLLTTEEYRRQSLWRVPFLGKERRAPRRVPPLKEHFPPGEYRLEVYCELEEMNQGRHSIVLLGRTRLTLVAD